MEKEKYGLLLGGKKPADVFIYVYKNGRSYAFDVAVASPFKKGVLRSAAQHQLAAAEDKAREKWDKYGVETADKAWKFVPVCFEALGGFSGRARMCIETIAKRAARNINVPKCVVIQCISREISAILARGAASLALRRMIPRDHFFIDC